MAQKRDLYQEVTNKIVASIEAGATGTDWSTPWHSINRGMPINATSGHEYRGVNVLMLWTTAIEAHYPTAQWASYKQWQAAGANVRKGERGTMIVYAGQIVKEDENKQAGETSSADRGCPKHEHVDASILVAAGGVDRHAAVDGMPG